MISTEHILGNSTVSVKISPISETTPINPRLAPSIEGFLAMMQKASFCNQDEDFRGCLNAFLEEVDIYLDDGRLGRADSEVVDEAVDEEIESFVNDHLPASMRAQLKRLGGK